MYVMYASNFNNAIICLGIAIRQIDRHFLTNKNVTLIWHDNGHKSKPKKNAVLSTANKKNGKIFIPTRENQGIFFQHTFSHTFFFLENSWKNMPCLYLYYKYTHTHTEKWRKTLNFIHNIFTLLWTHTYTQIELGKY